MAMGQQQDRQGELMVGWAEMARSPGHVFYDRLQSLLIEGGFGGFSKATRKPYYATRQGAPSVPPGRYFRIHLVGYFEGINSEYRLEWRCSGSLSLREFLRLESQDRVRTVEDPQAPTPRGAARGHQQPRASQVQGRPRGLQAECRDCRALLCPQPRPRRHAPNLWKAAGRVCYLFKPEECMNFFAADGYAPE